jgi:hypothetical protein
MIKVRSPAEAKDFSSSLCVQTIFEVHLASYPMGTGVLSPGVKCSQGVMLTIHPHLVLRTRMSRSCISSPPWRKHGIVGQLYFITQVTYIRFGETCSKIMPTVLEVGQTLTATINNNNFSTLLAI